MSLGSREMRRAKLRFGLLTVAVSLLVFLILLLTTLSNSLISSLVGALEGLKTDGLVYAASAQDTIAASRLVPDAVAAVAAVPGVSEASGVGTLTTRADVAGAAEDVQVFGFTPGAPGEPTSLSSGVLPTSATEAAVDGGAQVGETVVIAGRTLDVVGTLRGARFNALPTIYVTWEAYDATVRAANPGLPFVPVNAVAYAVAEGESVEAVTAAIQAAVPETRAYTLDEAVGSIPGIDSITQSFGILVGLTFIIGIVVIGFFFLILTVQKVRTFTLLRAIGSSTGRLAGTVALQISVVVLIASLIALALTVFAVRGIDTGIPATLDPATVIGTIGAVLMFSLVAGLLSIRRIARIDPSAAVGSR